MGNIALVGSFSTGKSTLAERLSKETGMKISSDSGRATLPDKYLTRFLELNKANAIFQGAKCSLYRLSFELLNKEYISDGGTISDLAYYKVAFKHYRVPVLMRDMIANVFTSFGKKNYSKIFYVPIEIPIDHSIERPSDTTLRNAIDKHVKSILDNNFEYTTVSGTIEERMDSILKSL